MTTEVNQPISKVEDLFKTLIWDSFVESEINSILGPIAWLLGPIVKMFTNGLYESIKTLIDVTLLPFINDEHKKAYDKASIELKVIAHDKGIDSPEYKDARNDAKIALSNFTQFNR